MTARGALELKPSLLANGFASAFGFDGDAACLLPAVADSSEGFPVLSASPETPSESPSAGKDETTSHGGIDWNHAGVLTRFSSGGIPGVGVFLRKNS